MRPISKMHRIFGLLLVLGFTAGAQSRVRADFVITARYVVTMDASRRVIENGAVAVIGDHIAAVGTRAEVEGAYSARQRMDRPNAILAPGLINTHTHAAMSLFRGIADDLKLQDWLQKFIFPAEAKNVDREFVRWGTRLALAEMALSGTTTYTDMYYFEDTVAEETKRAGLRGVLGETIIGFPAPDFKTPEEALRFTETFLKAYDSDPLIIPAPAPHSIYTLPADVLKASRVLADAHKKPLIIHLSETKTENDDSLREHKMTPTAWLESLGVLSGPTLAAHGVWLTDEDLSILKRRGTGLAHNPSSNMKLASGVAAVGKILGAGIPMGLGTDGVAGSNNDHNMFEEMDLAAKLQKVFTNDPQALPAREAFAMATTTGARALGMDQLIGSLEKEKRADLIAVSLDGANGRPLYDVYSQLVYALKGSDVSDVMVNGKTIVRNRVLLTIDTRAVYAKATEYQEKIKKSLNMK